MTRNALEELVEKSVLHEQKLRAVGSGHSFSDVAITDDVCVRLDKLQSVILEDGNRAVVEAGITIRELNDFLKSKRKALYNMGGYDAQTISGAISTATHGSGIRLGSLADKVQAVEVATEHGIRRFTPEHDDFWSVVVGMGSMGIVYRYELEVRDQFLLEENRSVWEWEKLKHELPRLLDDEKVPHIEVLINPYEIDGKHVCLLTKRKEVLEAGVSRAARTRAPLATFLSSVRLVDDILLWLVLHVPASLRWLNASALRSLADKRYVDESFRVFNLGEVNFVPAVGAEFAFGMDRYIEATERLFALAEHLAKQGHWHSSPISLRFVSASRHRLAPQYGRDTCMMEIPLLAGDPAAFHILRFYERIFITQYEARPHWGQSHSLVGAENVKDMYPEFEKWRATYKALNPRGTFASAFTRRLGL